MRAVPLSDDTKFASDDHRTVGLFFVFFFFGGVFLRTHSRVYEGHLDRSDKGDLVHEFSCTCVIMWSLYSWLTILERQPKAARKTRKPMNAIAHAFVNYQLTNTLKANDILHRFFRMGAQAFHYSVYLNLAFSKTLLCCGNLKE